MEQQAFYKDQYDRSLDRKNEINSSLSTPIGILSALIAGFLYAASNFGYEKQSVLNGVFILIGIQALGCLIVSIYHLSKALSDASKGYEYAYLPDAVDLNTYHNGLLAFYQAQAGLPAQQAEVKAQQDFDTYLTGLLIECADNNQKRNKTKTAHRFQCHRYTIFAFIFLALLIIPFGINFGLNKGKDKIQKVNVVNYHQDTTAYGKATRSNKADTTAHSMDTRRGRPRGETPGKH